ncbi:hypothetical protein [Pleomorphomonas sp. JP5]|uniref:hypothetical protein n=1 Tax=Pleomorphomonas sp. JP5 TaxID=2942998 RepID=UPI00204497DC|nr:hypothetical protein [Pleomorphomonas sp. JP5]MCM5557485.1 hypothetical protein [Pleomorphomonas sp. JP5]
MAVTQIPLSDASRDRLFGRAEDLFQAAIDDFTQKVAKAEAECNSAALARYADVYRQARALTERFPINSEEGIRARQLLFGLVACITSAVASEREA